MRPPFSLLLALPLLGAPLAPASAAATPPFACPAPQEGRAEWRSAFEKAMAVGATSEMERLVRKNEDEAVEWIIETAQGFAVAPSEALEKRMTALRAAWRGAMKSGFADNVYEYYSLLNSIQREQRGKAKKRYDDAQGRWNKNSERKDAATYGVLWTEFEGIAGVFEEYGDHYFASQAWLMAYVCVDQNARGDEADLYKACRALREAAAARERVDLKDRRYKEARAAYESLKAQGYEGDPGEAGEDGGGPPAAGPSQEGAAVSVALTFEMLEEVEQFERPSYTNDELHNIWTRVFLTTKGNKTRFATLGDLSPEVIRTGSAEVLVDTDGDGTGDLAWPMRGKIDPLRFEIGQGEDRRPWGVLTTIGTQQDMYQGIQMNMMPTDDQVSLYINAAASMVGELNGETIRIIDENMDGVYGSLPTSWGHDGLSPERLQPEMDCIVIGKGKRARPWSEYQEIGGAWYRLEVLNGGKSLKAYPVELETGALSLKFKGGKPTWLVVRGSGKYENSYFDLTEKGVSLPPGRWSLFCGELRKGKKIQTMKTLILPGEETPSWSVAAGETGAVELGAPFGFSFAFDEDGKRITVPGNTVVVTGAAGERYERPWNCVAQPSASYRKKGDKKGSKAEEFGFVGTQEEVVAGGWPVAWFPKDLVIDKKGLGDDSEVQLTEKKHKLFGKIESTWKD